MTHTPRPRPLRTLMGALTAVALALTAPAPAAASSDDLARILAGVAGAAILYGVLDANRRAQAAPQRAHPPAHARPPAYHHHRHARPHHPPRAQPHRPHRPVALPARCAIQVAGQGRGRTHVIYAAQCLQNSGVNLRSLPRNCEVQLRHNRQRQTAYDGACMRRAGFTQARR